MCSEGTCPALTNYFHTTNIPKKIHTCYWHPTAQMALHGGCNSQLYSILDIKASGTSQSPHLKQLFLAKRNERLLAYQVRPLTIAAFYKSTYFPQ